MNPSRSGESPALAVVSGIAGVLFGIIVGYVLASQQDPGRGIAASPPPPAPTSAPAAGGTPHIVDERELQAYRDILARDPKNVRALTELGNRLYDAGRFGEAVPYYQQAFELDARNINLSTDLGTALWYSGRADDALAQYEKSLAIDATHPQTLFNIGIVRLDGKRDPAGAVEVWERLLASAPTYPEADRVRRLIEQARARTTGPS